VKLTYGHIELLQDLLKGLGRISCRKHEEDGTTRKEEIPIEKTVYERDEQSDFMCRCPFHTVLVRTK
jgi:hypothetical protein